MTTKLSRCFYFILLMILLSHPVHSVFAQPKKHTKKMTKNIPSTSVDSSTPTPSEKEQLITDIEDNLYTVSYSASGIEMEDAMNFILDHPKEASPIVKEALFNPDLKELPLDNIWNVFLYLQKVNHEKISCDDLVRMNKIQKMKTGFIQKVVESSYATCPKQVNGVIATWLYDKDVIYYSKAFSLIIKLHLKEYMDTVSDIATITQDPVKLEGALTTLGYFKMKDPSLLTSLLINFNSYYEVIRYKTALIFATYPSFYPTLKKMLLKSHSPFSQAAIVRSIQHYNNPDVNSFLISLLPKFPQITTELTLALQIRDLTLQDFKDLIKIYGKAKSTSIKVAVFSIITQLKTKPLSNDSLSFLKDALPKIITSKKELASIKQELITRMKENPSLAPFLKTLDPNLISPKDDLTL